MPYKFYVCKFTNNKYPLPDKNKVLVKFGITHHTDVLDRFNPEKDDGYAKNYKDWDIECEFSWSFETKEEAEKIERYWLDDVFPNPGPTKVWVEKLYSLEDNNYYYDNTGITELRYVTLKQAKWILFMCYKMRDEANERN